VRIALTLFERILRKFLHVYRHIGEHLYWCFQEKRTRHGSYKIAEPEKALLDWIYLQRQEGLPVVLDELNLKVTDKRKLLKYASKYPTPVQQTLHSALSHKEQLLERRNRRQSEKYLVSPTS
jgi:hypothetical protein